MAEFVLRPVAPGQASIALPPSSKLLCRRPSRGQLPPDTFRLAEGNMLMPRIYSIPVSPHDAPEKLRLFFMMFVRLRQGHRRERPLCAGRPGADGGGPGV